MAEDDEVIQFAAIPKTKAVEAVEAHVQEPNSFEPDHLFFDESFSPVVEKILGRKLVSNASEVGEQEELFFIKVKIH